MLFRSVFIGVFLALGLEILRVPVMPFAIGLYLPIYLNATIMIGGVVRMFVDRRKNVDDKTKEKQATDGTLYCAGMIAGEGLVGILLAILAVVNVSSVFDLFFIYHAEEHQFILSGVHSSGADACYTSVQVFHDHICYFLWLCRNDIGSF